MATAKGQALGRCPNCNSWGIWEVCPWQRNPSTLMIQTRCRKNEPRNAQGMEFPSDREAGEQSGSLCDSVFTEARSSWSGNWMEKTLQELFGPYLGSNPFLRAAVLIRVATARVASLQNIPCRRWLAALPSGHQLPTLLTRGSKAPTKAITQAWLRLLGQLKQLRSCKWLHLLECFLLTLKSSFLLRLFASTWAWFPTDRSNTLLRLFAPIICSFFLSSLGFLYYCSNWCCFHIIHCDAFFTFNILELF